MAQAWRTQQARQFRDEGIVLGTHKLGEADRIVTLLTREHGQVRAVAKGVRRTKSRFGSRLEPFMVVDVQLHRGRSLDVVTQVELLEPFGGQLAADYLGYTAASAMAEAAQRLTEEDTSTRQHYLLLLSALRSLAGRQHHPRLALDAYLLRALSLAGWAPSLYDCAQCGAPGPQRSFQPPLGGAVCASCRTPGALAPAPETMRVLTALLTGDWPVADTADERTRREVAAMVDAYLQWHLERGLRSMRLVDSA
ncbi:DNA repair protein RecO [Sediminivirga luteola]|uniref:DNA repair protein RecO n=1 Tax=Sediminivirga luteola TaxID=1774748 RepID=A0A8J2TWV5_9MICO|nr:DNA repair protein RecO [Sediminivirga luteola]MCI2266234.1 DNA repair protein RecO [Sediminivirga luteola]GGA08488.1 DNA repair protein RecO [Sediminivirga luteola]